MERLLDIKDAAKFLNVSEMSIRRWTNSGKLKCYRVGGKRERRFRWGDLEAFLEGSKSHLMRRLGLGGQKVLEGSHMTHFYAGEEEALGVSIPYLVEGLKHREIVLVVMPPQRSRVLLKNLEQQSYPVGNWLKSGQLTVSAGRGSPEEMIRYLVGFAARANEFRVLGDMIWTARKGWDLGLLSALEQAPSLTSPVENGLLLCQYSLDDFSGATIMMAAEVHRQTIYKGKLAKSPYYAHEAREKEDHSTAAL